MSSPANKTDQLSNALNLAKNFVESVYYEYNVALCYLVLMLSVFLGAIDFMDIM